VRIEGARSGKCCGLRGSLADTDHHPGDHTDDRDHDESAKGCHVISPLSVRCDLLGRILLVQEVRQEVEILAQMA